MSGRMVDLWVKQFRICNTLKDLTRSRPWRRRSRRRPIIPISIYRIHTLKIQIIHVFILWWCQNNEFLVFLVFNYWLWKLFVSIVILFLHLIGESFLRRLWEGWRNWLIFLDWTSLLLIESCLNLGHLFVIVHVENWGVAFSIHVTWISLQPWYLILLCLHKAARWPRNHVPYLILQRLVLLVESIIVP